MMADAIAIMGRMSATAPDYAGLRPSSLSKLTQLFGTPFIRKILTLFCSRSRRALAILHTELWAVAALIGLSSISKVRCAPSAPGNDILTFHAENQNFRDKASPTLRASSASAKFGCFWPRRRASSSSRLAAALSPLPASAIPKWKR